MRHPSWALDLLTPRTPADRWALYDLIVEGLQRAGFGGTTARRFALAAVEHLDGQGGRVLIMENGAASGIALVRALVGLLELPFVEIDAGSLAETNWQGADLPWHLARLHATLRQTFPLVSVPALAERAVVHLHHLERLRLPSRYHGSATTADYQAGKQTSILPLLEGTPIPVDQGSGKGFIWNGRQALVVVSGTFAGLPPRPHMEDLADWGLLPALAGALGACSAVQVESAATWAVVRAIHHGVRAVQARFSAYGFRLVVTPQVIRRVAETVSSGTYPDGAGLAVRWIADACELALTRLLSEGDTAYTTYILAVDDLSLPTDSKGVWRE